MGTSKINIKNKDKRTIPREDIENYKPTHIKFNFSFITENRGFSCENSSFCDKHKIQLLRRILELSSKELITILAYNKNIGIEFISKESLKKSVEYNKRFDNVSFRERESKFAVFRLYTNNNPLPSRIIGKLIINVFYIMYIDLNHELY